jgi:hypothetical protein
LVAMEKYRMSCGYLDFTFGLRENIISFAIAKHCCA